MPQMQSNDCDSQEPFEVKVNISIPNIDQQHNQQPCHTKSSYKCPTQNNHFNDFPSSMNYNMHPSNSNIFCSEYGVMTEKLEKMEYDMIVIKSILDDYTINHAKGQLSSRDHGALKALTEPKPKPCVPACLTSLLVIADDNGYHQPRRQPTKSQEVVMCRQSKPVCKKNSYTAPVITMTANRQNPHQYQSYSHPQPQPRNNANVTTYKRPPVPPCPSTTEAQYDPCDLNYTDSTSNCGL